MALSLLDVADRGDRLPLAGSGTRKAGTADGMTVALTVAPTVALDGFFWG